MLLMDVSNTLTYVPMIFGNGEQAREMNLTEMVLWLS
jgi:hypothetical protein